MDSENTVAQTNDIVPAEQPDAATQALRRVQELEQYTNEGVANAVESETTGNDLVVIASAPAELVKAQVDLVRRMRGKLAEAFEESREADVTIEAIIAAGLSTAAVNKIALRAKHRVLYLQKILAALEAGYVMVPNFPGETIAVRVKRQRPIASAQVRDWSADNAGRAVADERPDYLPAGDGRYVAPEQRVAAHINEVKEDGKTPKNWLAFPTELIEEIGLPVEFLKPQIVQRTGVMLSRKIFDTVALSASPASVPGVQRSGKGDPMVLGRIINPSTKKMVTFLCAWFVDTAAI